MGPEHVPQCWSRHMILHHFTEDSTGLKTLFGVFTKTHAEALACFSLQLTSVRQRLRWPCLLLKIQPSVVFFFCQNIQSSLPAEAREVSEKTTLPPVFTCSLKFAVQKHPRRWRRNLSGWQAKAKTRKCQWVWTERSSAVLMRSPVPTSSLPWGRGHSHYFC